MRALRVLFVSYLTAFSGLIATTAGLYGADWPMWGHQTRNAVSPEKSPPITWQLETPEQKAVNIKWSAELGDHSMGNPVIAGGLVWVGTNNQHPRDPNIKRDAAVLMCFRESDGKFLYQYASPKLKYFPSDFPQSSHTSSPLVEGDRLWFCTNRCETVCLDIGPLRKGAGQPRVVWKVDMIKELGVFPRMTDVGSSANHCSIGASYKGLIYVNTTNGMDGGIYEALSQRQAPSLVCFRKDTGKVVWQDNSPGKNFVGLQHGSPLVLEINGRGQVIMGQGDGWMRSFDALTGKLIWKFDINPKKLPRDRGEDIRNTTLATPVFYENRVYIASGVGAEGDHDRPGRLCCIDPGNQGDISAELDDGPGKGKPNPNSGLVWEFAQRGHEHVDQMHCAFATVAIHDGLVIAPDMRRVHCLDAKTGKKYWTWTDPHGGELYGSPLIVDGKVYLANEDDEVLIFALAKDKKLLGKPELTETGRSSSGIHSSPVYANGVLYLMAMDRLYAIQQKR